MLTIKNVLMMLLLAISFILSCWSFLKSNPKENHHVQNTVSRPDAFMENVNALLTNKAGNPKLKIESPKMIHYHDHDTTYIVKPHISIYRDSSQPWFVNANFAKATNGISEILFWDNVIIRHEKDEANPTTTIKTTTLSIFPHAQIAKTKARISLFQPQTRVYGVGMLANMNNGSIKLLSETRGEYAPSS